MALGPPGIIDSTGKPILINPSNLTCVPTLVSQPGLTDPPVMCNPNWPLIGVERGFPPIKYGMGEIE